MDEAPCPVCSLPNVAEIDNALRGGAYPPHVALHYGVPSLALFAHKRHVPAIPPKRDIAAARKDPISAPKPTPAASAEAPAIPPKRPPIAVGWSSEQYRHVWKMQPHIIARSLTPQERCDPDINPAHPFAFSEPPEALTRNRIPQVSAGSSFQRMQERRDRGD